MTLLLRIKFKMQAKTLGLQRSCPGPLSISQLVAGMPRFAIALLSLAEPANNSKKKPDDETAVEDGWRVPL
jgi:hypothetical protein